MKTLFLGSFVALALVLMGAMAKRKYGALRKAHKAVKTFAQTAWIALKYFAIVGTMALLVIVTNYDVLRTLALEIFSEGATEFIRSATGLVFGGQTVFIALQKMLFWALVSVCTVLCGSVVKFGFVVLCFILAYAKVVGKIVTKLCHAFVQNFFVGNQNTRLQLCSLIC